MICVSRAPIGHGRLAVGDLFNPITVLTFIEGGFYGFL